MEMFMKKLFAVLMLSTLAVFAGCGDSGTGNDDDTGGTGGSAEAFFPVKLNATWTYTASGDETGENTETIIGTKSIGGKTYSMIKTTYTGGMDADTSYVRLDGNTLYSLIDASQFMVGKRAVAAKAASALAATAGEIEVPMMKFGLSAGATWDIYKYSGTVEGASVNVSITGKYIGQENVTVPKGSFSNCLKYQILSTVASSFFTSTSTQTIWLAENVGRVKTTDVSDIGTSTFSTTEVLKSYNIP
jgi:hypothetical protein